MITLSFVGLALMLTVLADVLVLLSLGVVDGYEDELGFHYGTEPRLTT